MPWAKQDGGHEWYGHVGPGLIWAFIAIWWTYNIFSKYIEAKFQSKIKPHSAEPYVNTVTFDGPTGLPTEGLLKVVLTLTGICLEWTLSTEQNYVHRLIHHGQHMTMWAGFLFSGIFDLVYRYGPVDLLPPRGDYILGVMAFAVMGVLFLWHLEGHTPLETQAHTFQIYSIFACAVVSLAEMVFVHDVRPALGRAFTVLLQGTWLITLGYVLDPPLGWPIWHDHDHGETLLLTQMYTWQWFLCVVIQSLVGLVAYWRVQRRLGHLVGGNGEMQMQSRIFIKAGSAMECHDDDEDDM